MEATTVGLILSALSALCAITSLVLVIIGWRILFGDTKRIATRNETFELIKDFSLQVENLKNEGIQLWLSNDAREIIYQNAKISSEIKSLRKTIEKLSATRRIALTSNDLIEIRRALTLNYKLDPTEAEIDRALNKIFSVSSELKWKAYSSFEKQHTPTH
jgi:hypothetical protein